MTYTPHLIAKWATGIDESLQPWLVPEDAQLVLLDGFVYRGVWEKRGGYDQFADGMRGGFPYCESRMIHTIEGFSTTGAIDGVNLEFTASLTVPAGEAIRRGGVTVIGTDPAQSFTDDGVGGFTPLTGSIDYQTGALSIELLNAPISGSVTVTYDLHQGLPVMGVMNFVTEDNVKELIVADTSYVNRYNPITNRLEDISPGYLLGGSTNSFFSWTDYPAPNSDPRLLFVNNKTGIQRYDGNTVSPYPVYTAAGPAVSGGSYNTGDGTTGPYEWTSPVAVLPSTVTITADTQIVTDDGFGNLIGDGSGTIDYLSGSTSVTFLNPVTAADPITIDYTPLIDPIDTCLHIFQFQDRLIVAYPTINSKKLGKTFLISGTGRFGDIFAIQAARPDTTEVFISGSGRIDISDNNYINSGDFNRDDLIIFTEGSTLSMKYTGNDAVPFQITRLDSSRGSQAPHGTITYLNLTTAQSPRGFVACDGYSLERTDDKIPRFSYDNIDLDHFDLCFAGTVDEDRDHYLIYPSNSSDTPVGQSDRILITNYEEFNYSIYRLPLSCMGNFFTTEDVSWDDLAIYSSWEEMAMHYSTWDAFAYQGQTPIGIGGGHRGEIVALNVTQSQDYPVIIRNITGANSLAVTITTDFQAWRVNDYIYLAGIAGAVELNNKQGFITEVIDNYTFVLQIDVSNWFTFSPYVPNSGQASKVIEFLSTTKKLNPYVEASQKVRCGWLYLYVNTTGTLLTDVAGNPVDAILKVRVITNDTQQPTDLSIPNSTYYSVNLTSHQQENGSKKWVKIWINQTARFLQFELSNNQAGANIQIQALMPGFAPVGRLI